MTTKIICVNRKKLEQATGYGLWGFLTLTILFFSIGYIQEASTNEIRTQERKDCANYEYNSSGERQELKEPRCWTYNDTDNCRDMFLRDDLKVCDEDYEWEEYDFRAQVFYSIINLVNFIVIGLWIYSKQSKVKLSWCEDK